MLSEHPASQAKATTSGAVEISHHDMSGISLCTGALLTTLAMLHENRHTSRFALVAVLIAAFVALLVITTAIWLRRGLYDRFVLFPREQSAWETLRAQRQTVTNEIGWTEFRGILHSHSELSHDCEVAFPEILRVLKSAKLDFICLSDHCTAGRADFDSQWRGLHEGKLFIPGFEMRQGFMPFGVKSGTVLSNSTPDAVLARQIVENDGVLFYAHPEEQRDWDLPELTGMEIYNIHVAFKRFRGGLRGLLPDVLLNLRRYPEHLYYKTFQRPTEFLQRWDQLNQTRRVVGIAGNDCHQNVGVRGFYTEQGTVRIEDTSPETLREFKLRWWERPLVRLAFGPLKPGRKLFHVQLDPYELSASFVTTHILASELSEAGVLDAVREGGCLSAST